jgi:hypothetical protein
MSKQYFTVCEADLYPLFAYFLKERKQAYEITIFVTVWMHSFQLSNQMADFQEICYKCGATAAHPNNTYSQFPTVSNNNMTDSCLVRCTD